MIVTLTAKADVNPDSKTPTGNSIQGNQLSGNSPFDIFGDGSGTGSSVGRNSCHTTNLSGAF